MELSAPKLYLPMLSGLMLGEAMSCHDGVRCYPAIRHSNQEKYIVKVISVPASQVQLDALLLTGAFPSRETALEYYMDICRDMLRETEILRQLSRQEGFIPYLDAQIISNDSFTGHEVYLLGTFRKSAEQLFQSETLTHKDIIRMSLDLCAALAACRREGYIYVDLKPENIFYSEDQGWRIGDIGFASIPSLAYSSLPEKYRSRYTAPELLDEMAVLNETVDVYALGLVLYQAYNGGQLLELQDGQPLPAPVYADYEFTDIIMKACHPDAAKRWKSPTELAQAIIAYIQRNPVSDEPIVPMVPEEIPEEPALVEAFLPEADPEELQREMAELEGTEYEELAFLTNIGQQAAENNDELTDLDVSEEISQILAQADELIAHELPEPAVAPGPVEIPMPEPIRLDPEEEPETPAAEEAEASQPEEAPDEAAAEEVPLQKETAPNPEKIAAPMIPKRPFPWRVVAIVIVALLLLSAAGGGYYFYENKYLQRIDSLVLDQNGNTLSVKVVTAVDQSLLTIVCSDSYGNTQRKSVTAGIAIFTGLDPQTHYTVRLEISGFHKLTGMVSDSFTTAAQTQISNLYAGMGSKDGSVVIQFDTAGPQVPNWIISYSAPGIAEKQMAFQGNIVQISDLQIGAEYTFILSRKDGQAVAGQTQVQYTASKIPLAEDLTITACGNGSLTAQWNTPEGTDGIVWIVRCHNSADFDQTVTTTNTSATFTGINHDVPCTVDVTAEKMPKNVSVTIAANPITVEQFYFTLSDNGMLAVSWDYSGIAAKGWVLEYTIDNAPQQPITLAQNSAVLLLIPGGTYHLKVTATDTAVQFGGACDYSCPEAEIFSQWGITADDLQSALCIRPDVDGWTSQDVVDEQYVSSFLPSQQAGLVIVSQATAEAAEETVQIRFIFRDAAGTLLYIVEVDYVWNQLWIDGCCALDIPWLPEEAGEYSVCVYFDGQYIDELTFSVTETE